MNNLNVKEMSGQELSEIYGGKLTHTIWDVIKDALSGLITTYV